METINQARPVSYDVVRSIMQPAAWPLDADKVEARRREAATLLGRAFPKLPRAELGKRGVLDLTAAAEWIMLDALRQGYAPHVAKL